jgi:hypothetical protein
MQRSARNASPRGASSLAGACDAIQRKGRLAWTEIKSIERAHENDLPARQVTIQAVLREYEKAQAQYLRTLYEICSEEERKRYEHHLANSYAYLCRYLQRNPAYHFETTPTLLISAEIEEERRVRQQAADFREVAGCICRGIWGDLTEPWLTSESAASRMLLQELRVALAPKAKKATMTAISSYRHRNGKKSLPHTRRPSR